MELFGGLMTMFGMASFFLAVIWFITPFVIFAIKGKVDRSQQLLEQIERRLAELEQRLPQTQSGAPAETETTSSPPPESRPSDHCEKSW